MFVIAVGSFFAGNATKRFFTAYTNLWYKHGVNTCTKMSDLAVYTTGGTGTGISFKTANGAAVSIFTTSSCNTTAVSVKLNS